MGANWAAINKEQNIPLLPDLYITGPYSLFGFSGIGIVQERWSNTYALSASVIKMRAPIPSRPAVKCASIDVQCAAAVLSRLSEYR